jgi:flagellar hook-associated protein 2
MASITSAGVGSGLDVESIISQLVALERRPIDKLDSKRSIINAQISAYGSLKSKISAFESAMAALSKTASFKKFSGTSSDEDIFTATVDSSAARGSFAVEVQALAARDKISAGPYASIDTQIGTGTLTLAVGSESFDITVDSSNNTVSGLRDAINSASDNTGVTASLVNTDAGYRLILSSNQTGTSNALTVTVSGDGDGNNTDNSGLSSLAYDVSGGVTNATAITTAKDAVITIDGFTVTNSSNTFADALQGVTFTAKSLGTASLEVQRDDGAIVESVKSFVDAFNALRTEIKTQRAGQLEADSTLLSIERGIVDVLNSGNAISGSAFSYLIQAGISIDKNGVMQVDEDDVISALNSDFNSFVSLFSAEGEGFAARFESLADSWLQNDGLIEAREDGLESQVKRIDNDKIRLEARIDIVEARLRSQYSALDTLVSQLSSTGSFLSQQLASLNSR